MLELHGLPGEQAQDEVQDLGGQLGCAHPELHGDSDQQGTSSDHGAEPDGGRDRISTGRSQTLHGREELSRASLRELGRGKQVNLPIF